MPLDINDFREEKGGSVAKLKASQEARFASTELIDEIVADDKTWRSNMFKLDQMRKEMGKLSKQVGTIKKAKGDAAEVIAQVGVVKAEMKQLDATTAELKDAIAKKIRLVGNYVHESVPTSKDEEKDSVIVGTWGEFSQEGAKYHHHELLHMIGGYESERGANVAGHRGYYLTGPGVLLNQALINFGIAFLSKKSYTPVQPPFFMRKDIMAETAQLEEFDEALYKVSSGDDPSEDKYLIATSEQPLSAYHRGERLTEEDLPKHYAGVSTCFRKEAGSHGRDAWGIFRIHQFEKIEQFVITDPESSWEALDTMVDVAKEFYEALELPYHVKTIVSGELNNAAAKKFDLEAWFPTLGLMRELVSASNCTDYQSRAMETRFGHQKTKDGEKQYVHMLNATLCATERTICCILENYQTPEGVRVPKVLQPFMLGLEFMPFVRECPVNLTKIKREKAASKKGGKKPAAAAPKKDAAPAPAPAQ